MTMTTPTTTPKSRQMALALIAGGLIVAVAATLAWMHWPARQARFDQAFQTDDDGKTWYAGSMYVMPPIRHDDKDASFAQVFSYANGGKQFCAYMTRFTPEGKRKVEAAIAATVAANKPAASTPLYADRKFMNGSMLVQKPGQGTWVPFDDPRANAVMSPVSPDGSAVDQVLAH